MIMRDSANKERVTRERLTEKETRHAAVGSFCCVVLHWGDMRARRPCRRGNDMR